MAGARVTRGLGASSAFADAIKDAAEPEILRLMQEVADEAVRRADAIVEAEFNNGRSPDRRHAGPHLLGNFVGKVERSGGGGLIGTIVLRSKAAGVKVNSLNSGSQPHDIGRPGQWLSFPAGVLGGQFKGNAAYFKKRKAHGSDGRRVAVRGPVSHPGTRASHFMERALEQAVRDRLRTPVSIPRR